MRVRRKEGKREGRKRRRVSKRKEDDESRYLILWKEWARRWRTLLAWRTAGDSVIPSPELSAQRGKEKTVKKRRRRGGGEEGRRRRRRRRRWRGEKKSHTPFPGTGRHHTAGGLAVFNDLERRRALIIHLPHLSRY